MAKPLSAKIVIKILCKEFGFYFVSQKGSHVKYRKDGIPILTVIVPAGRKQIPKGTFSSILRQSGLKAEDFE